MKTYAKGLGFKEVEAALLQLPKSGAKASGRRILKKAGAPIMEAAQAAAPRSAADGYHMADTYSVTQHLTRRQRKKNRKESAVEIYIGTGADPAAVQTEFGNEHQAAKPHLRPAWDAKQGEALEIIKTEWWSDIIKAITRLAKKRAKAGL